MNLNRPLKSFISLYISYLGYLGFFDMLHPFIPGLEPPAFFGVVLPFAALPMMTPWELKVI